MRTYTLEFSDEDLEKLDKVGKVIGCTDRRDILKTLHKIGAFMRVNDPAKLKVLAETVRLERILKRDKAPVPKVKRFVAG